MAEFDPKRSITIVSFRNPEIAISIANAAAQAQMLQGRWLAAHLVGWYRMQGYGSNPLMGSDAVSY